MRWLITLLFVGLIAIALALAGRYDPGYVVLVYPPWRVELSFIAFVATLLALIVTASLVLRFASYTLGLPDKVRARRARRLTRRADERFVGGLLAWVDQRHGDACELLAGWQGDSRRVGIARLLAARAAQRLGDTPRRDQLLSEAGHSIETALASQLFALETALDAGDLTRADQAVAAARSYTSAHPALLRLELRVAQQAQRWDHAAELIERLERERLMNPEHTEPLRRQILIERLRRATDEALTRLWKSAPASLKREPGVAAVAAARFREHGRDDEAIVALVVALNDEWDAGLVRQFGRCRASRADRQLDQAEKWLHQHPRDAQLLLALAELCSRAELWGKAQSYLEASLAVDPGQEAHLRMAELRERTGQSSEACRHYQAALRLCTAPAPD